MIFEMVIKETIDKALDKLDDTVTKENADNILNDLDVWENHKLLGENKAYIITKIHGAVQVMYTNAADIALDNDPVILNISDILDTIRKKCYKVKGQDPEETLKIRHKEIKLLQEQG